MNLTKATLIVAVFCVCGAWAAERTVSTAQGLYEAITNLNRTGSTIYLETGSYDMGPYDCGGYWSSDTKFVATNGIVHLTLNKLTLIGKSDNPRDTVIYGNRTRGVLYCNQSNLHNLTVSNGFLNLWNTSGAGVCSVGATSVHSNMVVTCCTIDATKGNGGGINGGKWYDSTIISNSVLRTNGGGVCGGILYNCTIISNYAAASGGGCYYGTTLHNCRVTGNKAGSNGGGVGTNSGGTRCKVYGGSIDNNVSSAIGGGAAYSLLYDGVVVSNNTAATYGGGVYHASLDGVVDFASNAVICCTKATGNGGGGCYSGICMDCEIYGNTAPRGGGGYYGTFTNCLVRGNTTTLEGGGLYSDTIVALDCRIVGNASPKGGGCRGGSYVDCTITNNLATGSEGGGGGFGGFYTNCLIACNLATTSATQSHGGGLASATAVGCVISNNVVETTSGNSSTGGAYGGGAYETKVFDSVVIHNVSAGNGRDSYGGGLHSGCASNTLITGNTAYYPSSGNRQGGGAYFTYITNCVVRNNRSGIGTGINAGGAVGCVISNNVGSSASDWSVRQVKLLENCEIVGPVNVYGGPSVNCRFVNFTNGVYIAPGENLQFSGHKAGSASAVLMNTGLWATNCLFANNIVPGGIFSCDGRSKVSLANCTIADNISESTFVSMHPTSRVNVVNCIFSGNRTVAGAARDLWYDTANKCISNITISSCLIGPSRPAVPLGSESALVTNVFAGFVKDGSRDAYALKHTSPARGKGMVQDWMAGALDIRQDEACPRLRDGLVDIGCYQCWLDPVGLWFSIR